MSKGAEQVSDIRTEVRCSYCNNLLSVNDQGYSCWAPECWIGMGAQGDFDNARERHLQYFLQHFGHSDEGSK